MNTKIRERKGCKKICNSVKSDLLSKTIGNNGRVLTSGEYVRFTRLKPTIMLQLQPKNCVEAHYGHTRLPLDRGAQLIPSQISRLPRNSPPRLGGRRETLREESRKGNTLSERQTLLRKSLQHGKSFASRWQITNQKHDMNNELIRSKTGLISRIESQHQTIIKSR